MILAHAIITTKILVTPFSLFSQNQSKLHPRAVIGVRILFWGSFMGKEKKPRKETTIKENTGKLLLDLGKLVVGGIIIGGIRDLAWRNTADYTNRKRVCSSDNMLYFWAAMDG